MTTETTVEGTAPHDTRAHRRRLGLGVAMVLVSPAAWLASLWLSYLVQDFACSAAASADAEAPSSALLVFLMVMNGVLFVVTALSGVVGGVLAHRSGARQDEGGASAAERSGTLPFLGWTAVVLALLFCYGIILIAANPLVFEVCS